ncbi:putative ascorbate peroxidase [Blyttiomyces helicus]|uniref:Peroxidase n=1 Tax=Blyttiomyces helicus TaxID=388810 RepID=A0A4P9WD68_9FUNG|nr:putative ascorbate peroxidase [Blyttiomyces helicus]|eukprot:RKO90474.1 putative ascorbate peroxidase [Blyttiomyces helicus]
MVSTAADYKQAKAEILELIKEKNCHPIFVRLAWHDAGTFCKNSKTGGPNASMQFAPVCLHGANAGLGIARDLLAPIAAKHPQISVADLWSLAGNAAIEYGAKGKLNIKWRAGRVDVSEGVSTPHDRLPDATQGAAHLRDIFYRMGFNDQEIVALSGAHSLGSMHADRSGFEGPWVTDPYTFSNAYFVQLFGFKWEEATTAAGNKQFVNKEHGTAMAPSDIALTVDPEFKAVAEKYAADEQLFFKDFAAAFQKLQELGVEDKLVEVEGF